ncbi:MAG: hypothetical protein IPJ47_12510 [Anaerolineales bacterium]|nr:hypothetical protein [Anaerolineales bacterium]
MKKVNIKPERLVFTILVMSTMLIIGVVFYISYNLRRPINYYTGADSYNESKHYSINPKTILEEVGQGKTGVFYPFVEPDEFYYDQPGNSYSWSQSDFMKIAQLDRYAWGIERSLAGKDIFFRGNCASTPLGFDTFNIRYFYTTNLKEYKYRLIGLFLTIDQVETGQDASSKVPLWGLKGFLY